MAVCLGCLDRRGVTILDGRISHNDLGGRCYRRKTLCPRCGIRDQRIEDDGPSVKRSLWGQRDVPDSPAIRERKSRRRAARLRRGRGDDQHAGPGKAAIP